VWKEAVAAKFEEILQLPRKIAVRIVGGGLDSKCARPEYVTSLSQFVRS
jgi:hypothetical protein